jgi:hypothetical protein
LVVFLFVGLLFLSAPALFAWERAYRLSSQLPDSVIFALAPDQNLDAQALGPGMDPVIVDLQNQAGIARLHSSERIIDPRAPAVPGTRQHIAGNRNVAGNTIDG